MPVESATYISDLNASNPASGDDTGEGDNHLRLIKAAIKATFPNITGAVTVSHTEINAIDGRLDALETATADYLKKDGSVAMTGSLNLQNHRVYNSLDPSGSTDLTPKGWVETNIRDPLRYRIGDLYITTVATNPATTLGYGTWEAFAAGRVLIGVGTGTDVNGTQQTFASGATGGEYTHTLTVEEMPAHTHTEQTHSASGASKSIESGNDRGTEEVDSGEAGGDGAHNNVQPYIAVYIWKRTA